MDIEQPVVLFQGIAIGHAGDIVGDQARLPLRLAFDFGAGQLLSLVLRQHGGILHIGIEDIADHPLRLAGHARHPVVAVHVLQQVALEFDVHPPGLAGETDQRLCCDAHVGQRGHTCLGDPAPALLHQIDNQEVDHSAHCLIHLQPFGSLGVEPVDLFEMDIEQFKLPQARHIKHASTVAVIDIMVVVGDLVSQIADLCLQRRLLIQAVLLQVVVLRGVVQRMVFNDPLTRLVAQVQPGKSGIFVLQLLHHAQRLAIVFEAAVGFHQRIQCVLTGVAERRVAEIMSQRHRLGQVFMQAHRPADGAGDLGHLDGVGQAGAVVVPLVIDENLRFVLQSAKGGGVNDTIAVSLIGVAVR